MSTTATNIHKMSAYDGGPNPSELQITQFDLLREIAAMRNVDPLTTELVRLRGARTHQCRICQSLRTVSALDAGGSEAVYEQIDHYETSDLPERQKVALRLVDAIITQPAGIDDALVAQLREQFTPEQVVEIIGDVMRNSMQKVAVALKADGARATVGVEYYDTDEAGDTVYFNQFSTTPA
jgi:alkylhydroperoxidase family enzyme